MAIDVLLSLSLITVVVIGAWTLAVSRRGGAARPFAHYCIAAGVITFFEIAAHYAPSEAVARQWAQAAAVWPVAWVFFVRFAVESAGLARHRRVIVTLASLLATTIAVSYFLLARRGVVVAAAPDYGFTLLSPFVNEPLGIVVAVCYLTILTFTFAVLLRGAVASVGRARRRQMTWILAAYVLGFASGVWLVLLREIAGAAVREVNGFSYLVTATIVHLGIVRKHLVDLTPGGVVTEALDQIDEAFFLTDERYRVVAVNEAARRLVRVPDSRVIGADLRKVAGADAGQLSGGDVVLESAAGESLTVSVSETLRRNHLDEVVGRIFVARDMTEERAREARLGQLLDEKNVILRELHHRLKNTLQMIDGLVTLKASRLDSPDARDVFEDIALRIRMIGQLYGNVYSLGELAAIPLDRALRDQCDQQLRTLHHDRRISMEFRLEPIEISVEAAVPILLAVAELVSNSLRHAYPVGTAGAVRLTSTAAARSRWRITVADDGPGVGSEHPQGAVGLMLAHELSRQVQGDLEVGASPGTTWTLTFPVREERPGCTGRSVVPDPRQ